jgi:hypothetical protein
MNILQTYVTRLYRVHASGCSSIHLEPVPVSIESLDPRFVFVLDTGLKIFMWYGKKSKNTFKSKARYNFLQGCIYLGVFCVTVEPNSSACVTNLLWAGWLENWGSVPGVCRYFCLCCHVKIVFGTDPVQRLLYGVIQSEHKTDLSGVLNC